MLENPRELLDRAELPLMPLEAPPKPPPWDLVLGDTLLLPMRSPLAADRFDPAPFALPADLLPDPP